MPGRALSRAILARDGFRCRFCGSRVVINEVRHVFRHFSPDAARQGRTNETRHFGLSCITASIDHIVPYSRGGTNDEDNLLTACGPCQFGRNVYTLEEVELANPFDYPPIVDDWDGLTRLLKVKPKRRTKRGSGAPAEPHFTVYPVLA
jgi:DNA-directed RNA polymerase subunit RPC12/RpoP